MSYRIFTKTALMATAIASAGVHASGSGLTIPSSALGSVDGSVELTQNRSAVERLSLLEIGDESAHGLNAAYAAFLSAAHGAQVRLDEDGHLDMSSLAGIPAPMSLFGSDSPSETFARGQLAIFNLAVRCIDAEAALAQALAEVATSSSRHAPAPEEETPVVASSSAPVLRTVRIVQDELNVARDALRVQEDTLERLIEERNRLLVEEADRQASEETRLRIVLAQASSRGDTTMAQATQARLDALQAQGPQVQTVTPVDPSVRTVASVDSNIAHVRESIQGIENSVRRLESELTDLSIDDAASQVGEQDRLRTMLQSATLDPEIRVLTQARLRELLLAEKLLLEGRLQRALSSHKTMLAERIATKLADLDKELNPQPVTSSSSSTDDPRVAELEAQIAQAVTNRRPAVANRLRAELAALRNQG